MWQKSHEELWNSIFESMNRWLPTKGLWREKSLFRKVIVEGIYPLHPISTYMLSQLSDYLQNRSSLMLLGRYVNDFADVELRPDNVPFVYPETLLAGDLFVEMLSAEEEGRQYSQHCIRFGNILRKYSDKLSENSIKILRANLAMRILRCRNESYEDVKDALCIFSGLDIRTIEEELVWLENEYAVLGYDDHSCCLDFLEDSSGAHDFRTYFKRLRANTSFSNSIFEDKRIRELAEVTANQPTNFASSKKIKTNEWQFEQELFPITDLSEAYIESCLATWKQAVSTDKPKGKLIWLYINRDSDGHALENAAILAQKTANTPIVMMLLNDAENKLNSALCDYLAVQKMSDSDRKKYGRHFEDKLQQTEENIRNAFDLLRKQRMCILPDGAVQLKERLAVALTGVFENVYPKAVPFDFDGFDSKQPAKARKAFCSITRLLLSGAISDDTVHSFPADVRNRLEATLFTSSAYSWKIINSNYQIIPPENKAVREVYNTIVDSVPENGEIALDELLNKLMAPPYGMNDYASVYMVTTVCSNLSYCLRAILNGEIYSITVWKDKVIQDNKVDLNAIRKSVLKRVNAGAVADRFLRLFAQIDNNTDFDKVDELNIALVNLKQSEDVPEELSAQYQLALNKIKEGAKIRKNWRAVSEDVDEKFDKLLEKRDIYSGLLAIQKIRGTAFMDCFRDSGYIMSENQKQTITEMANKITGLINPFIIGWINEQQCRGVENISQYRKHMERIQNLLSELGYVSEAKEAQKRAEKELSNVENIRARQELRSNYKAFIDECVVAAVVPYTRLLDWKNRGDTLIVQIDKFVNTLGSDAERFKKNAQQRVQSISNVIEKIKNDMNDIYDDLDNVSSVEDIEDMVQRIHLVCQKGIPTADLNDFTDLQKTLEAVQQDLNDLTDCKNDRDEAQKLYQELHSKYSEQDLDFDVVGILDQVNVGVVAAMDAKDQAWRSRYLLNQSNERSALLQWVDNTRAIPGYLSDKTKEEYFKRKKFVEQQLSKARIGDVVFSFKKLEGKEQEECFDQLVEIYQSGNGEYFNEESHSTQSRKWDLEEWIILVKFYFDNKGSDKSELINGLVNISTILNRRADYFGIEHDENYRNVNGLAMQYDRIRYLDTDGAEGLSAYSELAEAATEMYHNDPEGFTMVASNCWKKYGEVAE